MSSSNLLRVCQCTGRPEQAAESRPQIFPPADRSWWSASGCLCRRWWRVPWERRRQTSETQSSMTYGPCNFCSISCITLTFIKGHKCQSVPQCVSLVLQVDSVVFWNLVSEVRQQRDFHWSKSALLPGRIDPVNDKKKTKFDCTVQIDDSKIRFNCFSLLNRLFFGCLLSLGFVLSL